MEHTAIDTDWEGFYLGKLAWPILAIVLYGTLYFLQMRREHPSEPPIVASRVPFLGPLLGMMAFGGRHIKLLARKHENAPIFTLPVPGSRMYVVSDPALTSAVQRATKTLSFSPLVPPITRRVLGLDARTEAVVKRNLDPEPGQESGFLSEIHDLVYTSLGPGDTLDALLGEAIAELGAQVEKFAYSLEKGGGDTIVDSLRWIRGFVAMATARFLYGPESPLILHPELEDAFWAFDHGLGGLLMGILPSLTARAAYKGREALAAAYTTYISSGAHKRGGSALIQRRIEIAESYGWTTDAAARSEVSFLFAGIVNTATTTFWTVLHLFANPSLLTTVRAEVSAVLSENQNHATRDVSTAITAAHTESLRNACPTLTSVFREVLRTNSDNFSTRLVKSDTFLADKYFLRAGSVVQIAGGAMHADPRIWGADVDAFNPARFQRGGGSGTVEGVHPAAFRAFGGGKTLCPGRHFATNEILALVAMLVMRFDITGVDGKKLEVPAKDDMILPVHILEPKGGAPKVTVRLRGT